MSKNEANSNVSEEGSAGSSNTAKESFTPPENKETLQKMDKDRLTPSEREELIQSIIVKTILWMTIIGIFITAIGLVWAIGDLFSTDKFNQFLQLSLQTKLFIIGLVLLGILFLVLFLVVFYKRGSRNLQKSLFKPVKPSTSAKDEAYEIAKYIAAGTLIAVFLIFTGLIIALIEFLFGKFTPNSIPDFLTELTGGSITLIIGLIILLFDGLVYSMVFIWQNGHNWVIESILAYNERVESTYEFTSKQQLTGKIIFGLIVFELIGVVFGVVWAIIESITGDWGSQFREYPVGVQISFYGIFAALFFGTMVFSMFFYKRGNNLIMISLFVQYHPKDIEKENTSAKVITIGILLAISLITIGLIIWLVSLIVNVTSGGGEGNIFTILAGLSSGLTLLAYSGLIGVFTILGLLFSYFLHNGYFFTLEKILLLEEKIDSGLDEGISKSKEKKKKKEKKEEK
ncbi:MAG: hypothetical protein K9W44_04950 [Candidatus Lokiarchaeota archaeon]|nr:hypothetical protein [Candidatus Harpocratesius repetitus]